MEEVDRIIIDSLRNINCDIEDEIQSLGEFAADLIFASIVCCLEAIKPHWKLSHKLASSMNLRLKQATNVAECIKELGYRGDMGYQTILYCNEVEVRRVLMFLVERLPREASKITINEELGYVPKLVKEIEEKLKLSLSKPWVPNYILKNGLRDCGKVHLRQGFSSSHPLRTENLRYPNLQETQSEALKQYYVHQLPDVTRQVTDSKNLIPSLLFKDSEFSISNFKEMIIPKKETLNVSQEEISPTTLKVSNHKQSSESTSEDSLQEVIESVNCAKKNYQELELKHKMLEAKLSQVTEEKEKRETALKQSIAKVKTKSKALAVLSNEENLEKLKNLVDNGSKRLIDLANQWNEVQTPLLEQYHEMKQTRKAEEAKIQTEQQKIKILKERSQQLMVELQEKEKLEQQLRQEFEKLNKNTHRSAYTRRILEIIANIKKQNEDIQKILKDTKDVQKDINTLNGQLDRSFTLSDELIFRDAKRDEMARKAYKLLAALHTDCGEIVQTVTDLGSMERECRTLQDQVDAELARETISKLEKVTADFAEVKKETNLLLKQLQEKV